MFRNKREVILFIALAMAAFFMTVGITEVFADVLIVFVY